MVDGDDRLMARPVFMAYDWPKRAGMVMLEALNCTDMMGCIGFFSSIDPKVQHISVSNARGEDTVYWRDGGDVWHAKDGQARLDRHHSGRTLPA